MFPLPRLSVIDITGNDAAAIVHNLTTNQVKSLEGGQGHESFVTDVRGKTLGHVLLYRCDNGIRLIGPAGQSERIAQHIDRYTIREDATPSVRDDEFAGLVLSPPLAKQVIDEFAGPEAAVTSLVKGALLRKLALSLGGAAVELYGCHWLGEGSGVLLIQASEIDAVAGVLSERFETQLGDEAGFHAARTFAGFPWYGIDLDETNLPQEADRDAVAISFTKGCYLGQETVARLDALGQVQKKLVRWSIDGGIPAPGTTLQAGEKTVGRLTSVAAREEGGAVAIGPARRSHFEPGAIAMGISEPGSVEVTATVLGNP